MALDLLFTNQSSASAAQTSSFVQDAFVDIALPATNNSGLTSTTATNPTGAFFANDNTAKFGPKTLYIKGLTLIEDRTKWINSLPTYAITWHEDYPGVVGYVFGRPSGTVLTKKQTFMDGPGTSMQRACVTVGIGNALGEGIGVTFKGRRVSFLVEPSASGTYDSTVYTDGVAGTAYSLNNAALTDYSQSSNTQQDQAVPHYVPLPHSSANETDNIHDFQIRTAANPLSFTGVVVYWENSGSNIEIAPGTNYVNKTQVLTTTGTTLSVPSMGSSLGGKALIYQLTGGGYTFSVTGPSYISSIAQGSSGTNLLNVTTGQGSRFVAGYGVIVNQGTSNYVGSITQVSTDTLTVSPTLSFGISNTIYVAWQANGATIPVSATLMEKVGSLDFGMIQPSFRATFTIQQIFDPIGRWACFQSGFVFSYQSTAAPAAIGLTATSGSFLQVEGRFSAMEVETVGTGLFHATCFVNGHPSWGINTGTTAGSRFTLFTNAGPGWNSAVLYFGSSHTLAASLGIQRINFYQIEKDPGITYGQIAEIGVQQAAVERPVNSTLIAPGTYQRIYADLAYAYPLGSGASYWINSTASNGQAPLYSGFSGGFMDFYYYGKNFALGGTLTGGSFIVQLDGANVGSTFNVWQTVASEGFHKVQVQVKTSGPSVSFLDVRRTREEIKNLTVNSSSFQSTNAVSSTTVAWPSCKYVFASTGDAAGGSLRINYNLRLYDTHAAVRSIGQTQWAWSPVIPGRYAIYANYFCPIGGAPEVYLFKNGEYLSNLGFQTRIGGGYAEDYFGYSDVVFALPAGPSGTTFVRLSTLGSSLGAVFFSAHKIAD